MRLFDWLITAGGRDDLNVLYSVEHRKSSDRGSVATALVSMNQVWNVIIHRKPFQKGDCRLDISPSLQKYVQYRFRVINCPPQPMLVPLDLDTLHL